MQAEQAPVAALQVAQLASAPGTQQAKPRQRPLWQALDCEHAAPAAADG